MPSPLWPFYTEVTAAAVSVAVMVVTLAGYASPDPASRPFFGPDMEVTAEGGYNRLRTQDLRRRQ
jgi:hypothetical protein